MRWYCQTNTHDTLRCCQQSTPLQSVSKTSGAMQTILRAGQLSKIHTKGPVMKVTETRARTLNGVILLCAPEERPRCTIYVVEAPPESKTGGSGFDSL